MNDFLSKYWAHIPSWVFVALQFLTPSLTAYEAAHPKATATVLIGIALTFFHSRAPKDKLPQ